MDQEIPFLTTGESAKFLQVAPETIRLWERLGQLPAIRTSSGQRLFLRATVIQKQQERAARKSAR